MSKTPVTQTDWDVWEHNRRIIQRGLARRKRAKRPDGSGRESCLMSGCINDKATALGLCAAHQYRLERGLLLDSLKSRAGTTEAQRFWAQVDKSHGDDDCWVWTGRVQRSRRNAVGYGSFAKHATAHRWAYEHMIGPVPKGMILDHKDCRNTLCVNPFHVLPVTHAENAANKSPLASLGVHRYGWKWLVVKKIEDDYEQVAEYDDVMDAIARALKLHGIT